MDLDNISEIWLKIASKLEGGFQGEKGIYGLCPFCHNHKSLDNKKFVISFDRNNEFAWYNCFYCGSSHREEQDAIRRLCSALNIHLSPLEYARLGENISSHKGYKDDEADEAGIINWPPRWVICSEELTQEALNYMKLRGISSPQKYIDAYEIVFSKVILSSKEGEEYSRLNEVPSIIFPMYNSNLEKIGWTSRKIEHLAPKEAIKALSMSGGVWEKQALLGLNAVNPSFPVSLVEGGFSSMSTPNSVAASGKSISQEQIKMLAELKAPYYIIALDPDVEPKKIDRLILDMVMAGISSPILRIDWSKYPVPSHLEGKKEWNECDPNDHGWEGMKAIIKDTLLSAKKIAIA